LLKICNRRLQPLDIIIKRPKGQVALVTQKSTDALAARTDPRAAGVVMVDVPRPLPGWASAEADCTRPSLPVEDLLVLGFSYAVLTDGVAAW